MSNIKKLNIEVTSSGDDKKQNETTVQGNNTSENNITGVIGEDPKISMKPENKDLTGNVIETLSATPNLPRTNPIDAFNYEKLTNSFSEVVKKEISALIDMKTKAEEEEKKTKPEVEDTTQVPSYTMSITEIYEKVVSDYSRSSSTLPDHWTEIDENDVRGDANMVFADVLKHSIYKKGRYFNLEDTKLLNFYSNDTKCKGIKLKVKLRISDGSIPKFNENYDYTETLEIPLMYRTDLMLAPTRQKFLKKDVRAQRTIAVSRYQLLQTLVESARFGFKVALPQKLLELTTSDMEISSFLRSFKSYFKTNTSKAEIEMIKMLRQTYSKTDNHILFICSMLRYYFSALKANIVKNAKLSVGNENITVNIFDVTDTATRLEMLKVSKQYPVFVNLGENTDEEYFSFLIYASQAGTTGCRHIYKEKGVEYAFIDDMIDMTMPSTVFYVGPATEAFCASDYTDWMGDHRCILTYISKYLSENRIENQFKYALKIYLRKEISFRLGLPMVLPDPMHVTDCFAPFLDRKERQFAKTLDNVGMDNYLEFIMALELENQLAVHNSETHIEHLMSKRTNTRPNAGLLDEIRRKLDLFNSLSEKEANSSLSMILGVDLDGCHNSMSRKMLSSVLSCRLFYFLNNLEKCLTTGVYIKKLSTLCLPNTRSSFIKNDRKWDKLAYPGMHEGNVSWENGFFLFMVKINEQDKDLTDTFNLPYYKKYLTVNVNIHQTKQVYWRELSNAAKPVGIYVNDIWVTTDDVNSHMFNDKYNLYTSTDVYGKFTQDAFTDEQSDFFDMFTPEKDVSKKVFKRQDIPKVSINKSGLGSIKVDKNFQKELKNLENLVRLKKAKNQRMMKGENSPSFGKNTRKKETRKKEFSELYKDQEEEESTVNKDEEDAEEDTKVEKQENFYDPLAEWAEKNTVRKETEEVVKGPESKKLLDKFLEGLSEEDSVTSNLKEEEESESSQTSSVVERPNLEKRYGSSINTVIMSENITWTDDSVIIEVFSLALGHNVKIVVKESENLNATQEQREAVRWWVESYFDAPTHVKTMLLHLYGFKLEGGDKVDSVFFMLKAALDVMDEVQDDKNTWFNDVMMCVLEKQKAKETLTNLVTLKKYVAFVDKLRESILLLFRASGEKNYSEESYTVSYTKIQERLESFKVKYSKVSKVYAQLSEMVSKVNFECSIASVEVRQMTNTFLDRHIWKKEEEKWVEKGNSKSEDSKQKKDKSEHKQQPKKEIEKKTESDKKMEVKKEKKTDEKPEPKKNVESPGGKKQTDEKKIEEKKIEEKASVVKEETQKVVESKEGKKKKTKSKKIKKSFSKIDLTTQELLKPFESISKSEGEYKKIVKTKGNYRLDGSKKGILSMDKKILEGDKNLELTMDVMHAWFLELSLLLESSVKNMEDFALVGEKFNASVSNLKKFDIKDLKIPADTNDIEEGYIKGLKEILTNEIKARVNQNILSCSKTITTMRSLKKKELDRLSSKPSKTAAHIAEDLVEDMWIVICRKLAHLNKNFDGVTPWDFKNSTKFGSVYNSMLSTMTIWVSCQDRKVQDFFNILENFNNEEKVKKNEDIWRWIVDFMVTADNSFITILAQNSCFWGYKVYGDNKSCDLFTAIISKYSGNVIVNTLEQFDVGTKLNRSSSVSTGKCVLEAVSRTLTPLIMSKIFGSISKVRGANQNYMGALRREMVAEATNCLSTLYQLMTGVRLVETVGLNLVELVYIAGFFNLQIDSVEKQNKMGKDGCLAYLGPRKSTGSIIVEIDVKDRHIYALSGMRKQDYKKEYDNRAGDYLGYCDLVYSYDLAIKGYKNSVDLDKLNVMGKNVLPENKKYKTTPMYYDEGKIWEILLNRWAKFKESTILKFSVIVNSGKYVKVKPDVDSWLFRPLNEVNEGANKQLPSWMYYFVALEDGFELWDQISDARDKGYLTKEDYNVWNWLVYRKRHPLGMLENGFLQKMGLGEAIKHNIVNIELEDNTTVKQCFALFPLLPQKGYWLEDLDNLMKTYLFKSELEKKTAKVKMFWLSKKMWKLLNESEYTFAKTFWSNNLGQLDVMVSALTIYLLGIKLSSKGWQVLFKVFGKSWKVNMVKHVSLWKSVTQMVRNGSQLLEGIDEEDRAKLMYVDTFFGRSGMDADAEEELGYKLNHPPMKGLYTNGRLEGAAGVAYMKERIDYYMSKLRSKTLNQTFEAYYKSRVDWCKSGAVYAMPREKEITKEKVRNNKRLELEKWDYEDFLKMIQEKGARKMAKGHTKLNELVKQRWIFGVDTIDYILSNYLCGIMEKVVPYTNLGSGRYSDLHYRAKLVRLSRSGFYHNSFDFANMNSLHTKELMVYVFKTGQKYINTGNNETVRKDIEWVTKYLCESIENSEFEIDGKVYKQESGMFTGARETSFFNTLFNIVYCDLVLENMRRLRGENIELEYRIHQGDDLVVSFAKEKDAVLFSDVARITGMVSQESKMLIKKNKFEFLRKIYANGYEYGALARSVASFVSGNWESKRDLTIEEKYKSVYEQCILLERRGIAEKVVAMLFHNTVHYFGSYSKKEVRLERCYGTKKTGGFGFTRYHNKMYEIKQNNRVIKVNYADLDKGKFGIGLASKDKSVMMNNLLYQLGCRLKYKEFLEHNRKTTLYNSLVKDKERMVAEDDNMIDFLNDITVVGEIEIKAKPKLNSVDREVIIERLSSLGKETRKLDRQQKIVEKYMLALENLVFVEKEDNLPIDKLVRAFSNLKDEEIELAKELKKDKNIWESRGYFDTDITINVILNNRNLVENTEEIFTL